MCGRQDDDRSWHGHLEPGITERGTMGWRVVVEDRSPERAIGDSSIGPLIDLGLVELVPDARDRLTISARGRATWERFLAAGGQYPEDLPPF